MANVQCGVGPPNSERRREQHRHLNINDDNYAPHAFLALSEDDDPMNSSPSG